MIGLEGLSLQFSEGIKIDMPNLTEYGGQLVVSGSWPVNM